MVEHTGNHRNGFTLVELMIVVVIIGLLASLAIPKFSSVVARSKLTEIKQQLWHIIHLEKTFYYANDRYVGFDYGEDSPVLGFNQPEGSNFTYMFDADTQTASGMEDGASHDINFDEDGDDGLTVNIDGTEDVISGSSGEDFAW